MKQAEKKHTSLDTLRHSCAHVMAKAVLDLFPGTKLAIGPSIQDGFYYDFDPPQPFKPEDLPRIEKRMKQIAKKNLPFSKTSELKSDALKRFSDDTYKNEILRDIPDENVSFYTIDDFTDLCRGPHVRSTHQIKHFKLLSIAGAYWRGDEKREMLQRIYGTIFETEQELTAYLERIEEAKKRDHRIIGKTLDLFSIQEQAGAGLIFWHPKGALIRHIIETTWKEYHLEKGYQLINSPHIARIDLWKTSGHLDFYRENMYAPITVDDQQYILKPMNCPGHILIYKSRLHSYRELPIKYAELGTVYRYERSGVLHGLMRVRGFTQDDAHVFCSPSQLESEIGKVIDCTLQVLNMFGFDQYDIMLSTRPEKYVGTLDEWARAEEALKHSLEKAKLSYRIDPGEGVFYGPKIDLKIKDCLGRSWQCSTIQVDFNIPERFDVTFRNSQGKDERVIMIHRALMGSLERFFGILIEHYKGAFPVWLSPVQCAILPITETQCEYAQHTAQLMRSKHIRVEVDVRNEKLGFKIREATMEKVPFIAVVGKNEMNDKTLSVRSRGGKDLGILSIDQFVQEISRQIESKV